MVQRYKLGRATPYGNHKAKTLPDTRSKNNDKPKVELLKEKIQKEKKKLETYRPRKRY